MTTLTASPLEFKEQLLCQTDYELLFDAYDVTANKPKFDPSFIDSLRERWEEGREFTNNQRQALANIIDGWV